MLIKQLPKGKKEQLVELLARDLHKEDEEDTVETHLASEKVLARDWNTPEEDEVWQDL